MARPRRQWRTAVAVGALAALGLVACGGGGSVSPGDEAAPAEQPRAAGPQPPAPDDGGRSSAIPQVTVLDVASGDEFALGSIVPSDRPVLVWFWAPH